MYNIVASIFSAWERLQGWVVFLLAQGWLPSVSSVWGHEPKSIPMCFSVQYVKGIPRTFCILPVVIAWLIKGKVIGLFGLLSDRDLTFQAAWLSVLSQYPMGSFYTDSHLLPYLLQKLNNLVAKQINMSWVVRKYGTWQLYLMKCVK